MSFVSADNHIQWADKIGGTRVVFEDNVMRLTGGCLFKLSQMPDYPNLVPAGTPVLCDEVARTLDIHYAFVVAEAAATDAVTIKLAKGFEGSRVKEGMILMPEQKTVATKAAKAVTVTNVDRSNPEYDAITVEAALGAAIKKGDVLWEGKADGSNFVIKVVPNALTERDHLKNPAATSVNGTAVFGCLGCVLENRIPPISAAVKAAMKEADCYFRYSNHK